MTREGFHVYASLQKS